MPILTAACWAYSRAKSGGYHEETIRAGGDYTLRNYLYDAVGQNSLEEFLLKNVLDPQKPSFREAIANLLTGELETLWDGAFKFKYGDDEYELKALVSTAKDPENANTVTLQLVHMASGSTLDIGTVLPDLLPEFAERLIRKVDEELDKPDWKTNNYGIEKKLINEMVDLLVLILRSVVMTPLDENDPDSTALRILNDGNLTYCRGDEAFVSDEQKAKWDALYGLISGKRLRELLSYNIRGGLDKMLNDSEHYPVFASIFGMKFTEDGAAKPLSLSICTSNPEHFQFLDPLGYYLWFNDL